MSVASREGVAISADEKVSARSPTRPFYWSVRREFWENRWLYLAPAGVAAVVLIGFVISLASLPQRRRVTLTLDAAHQAASVAQPYGAAALLIAATTVVVGVAYCLGALHGERRDRSILFWKSLPVSDLTTVLSKASIPLVALPVTAWALTTVLQIIVLALNSAVLQASGLAAVAPGAEVQPVEMAVVLAYGLAAFTVWWSPLYAWCLLVSGWAKRVPFLWAFVPPIGLCLIERITLGSSHLAGLLERRVSGAFELGFIPQPGTPGPHHASGMPVIGLAQLDPLQFLASPELWIGLVAAAGLLAAAVWMRRRREPI